MAVLYAKTNRFIEAEPLCRKALEIRLKVSFFYIFIYNWVCDYVIYKKVWKQWNYTFVLAFYLKSNLFLLIINMNEGIKDFNNIE